MKRRCVLLSVLCALGLSYFFSTNVRAALWASGLMTAVPDTWVVRLLPTGSMEPTLTDQDWLVFQHIPFSHVQMGDIISFRCPIDGVPVTHRVVRRLADGRVVTRGDNNPDADPWVIGPENYRGLLIAVYSDR
jgi:signal peptidase I